MKTITGLMMLAAWSIAAPPAMAKPCTPASAAGIWSLVSIRAAEPGVEDFYRTAPNEIMRFTATGGFMYVASNRPFAAAEAARRLDAADARDGTTYRYSIARTGTMTILRDGTPFQTFQCTIADAAGNVAQPGDMILTNAPGASMLRRVQRKVR